ncbi:MAG: hypothetical protein ACTSRC_05975 [Candidatus Helarchaeota archaeon]
MIMLSAILQDWNASLHNHDEIFHPIVKEITSHLKSILVSRAYIAIIDAAGTIHYIDTPAFDEYIFFIQRYTKKNFHLLKIGNHSIPFGGVSLAFFKISLKALVILYMPKGPVGQLLVFKPIMAKWAEKLDELIGEIEVQSSTVDLCTPIEQEMKQITTVKRVPLLVKPLPNKRKYSMDVATVLQYCDGTYSLEEICDETKFSRLKVDLILREYQKKKFIKILRVL